MSKQPAIGPECPSFDAPVPQLKLVALVQLIATVTLALSALIVATAVSIGLARAGGPCPVAATQVTLDAGDRIRS
jgi:hypothetical protein